MHPDFIQHHPPAMPSLLGKRKSRSVEAAPEAPADAQELLRRHFEAHFKPLAVAARAAPKTLDNDPDADGSDGSEDGDNSSESGWSGVSDENNDTEDGDGEGMSALCHQPDRDGNAETPRKKCQWSRSSTTHQRHPPPSQRE